MPDSTLKLVGYGQDENLIKKRISKDDLSWALKYISHFQEDGINAIIYFILDTELDYINNVYINDNFLNAYSKLQEEKDNIIVKSYVRY